SALAAPPGAAGSVPVHAPANAAALAAGRDVAASVPADWPADAHPLAVRAGSQRLEVWEVGGVPGPFSRRTYLAQVPPAPEVRTQLARCAHTSRLAPPLTTLFRPRVPTERVSSGS